MMYIFKYHRRFSGYAKKIFIPYAPTYGDSFKQGSVVKIDTSTKKVTLDTGDEIEYDYLVLATGTTGNFPGKLDTSSIKNASQAVEMYTSYVDKVIDNVAGK